MDFGLFGGLIKNRPRLVCAKFIFKLILKVSDKFIEKSRYGPIGHFSDFLEFFGDRMANLGLIDFKLGLYIKVNLNDGQKNLKFILHISKHLAKMTINWHKIGWTPLFGKNIEWE